MSFRRAAIGLAGVAGLGTVYERYKTGRWIPPWKWFSGTATPVPGPAPGQPSVVTPTVNPNPPPQQPATPAAPALVVAQPDGFTTVDDAAGSSDASDAINSMVTSTATDGATSDAIDALASLV